MVTFLNLMAKDESTKSLARSSCEKISKATFGSLRRISQCPKNTKPLISQTPSVPLQQPIQIPSESFPPPQVKPVKKFVRFSSSNIKETGDGGGGKELTGTGQKTFSEEKYNAYIDGTKMKMRAPSSVSGGTTISRRESFNDMFSGYISRTKLRLRTTSSVGTDGKTK